MSINENQVLTVGEVARRSGVAVSTIHFYERQGLIEGWRTEGNRRRYHRRILRRIAIIRIAHRAGIPLADHPRSHAQGKGRSGYQGAVA